MAQTTPTQAGTMTQSHTGSENIGQCIPFDSINEPGAYVCNWSGHLIRVPNDAVTAGRSPLVSMCGPDKLFVTKISNNPFVPLTKARLLACNCDVSVNF